MKLIIIIGISILVGFTSANHRKTIDDGLVFFADEEDFCTVNEKCIPLVDCAVYISVFKSKTLPIEKLKAYVQLVRNHQCGFIRYMPLVCCPKISEDSSEKLSNVKDTKDDMKGSNGIIKGKCSHAKSKSSNKSSIPCDNSSSYAECGKDSNYRRKFGTNAELSDFPWLALLEYETPNGKEFLCSGALINDQYILTAAHCVTSEPMTLTSVVLGEYDTSTSIDCTTKDGIRTCANSAIKIDVDKVYYHEGYSDSISHREGDGTDDSDNVIDINIGSGNFNESVIPNNSMGHDIGLIKLKEKVTFSPYIQPICLPQKSHDKQKFFVSGWGRNMNIHTQGSDRKRMSKLTEIEFEDCENLNVFQFLTKKHICAGSKSLNERPCVVDSGAPLMGYEKKDDGSERLTIFGVSYMDTTCDRTDLPGIYTRVYDYMPWILKHIGEK